VCGRSWSATSQWRRTEELMSLCSLGRAHVMVLACLVGLGVACSPSPTAPAAPTTGSAGPTALPSATATSFSCKVAQVYAGPTTERGWSWAHEQSFLAIKTELPWVDLSLRKDSVSEDNTPAVEDILERMVQQGPRVVYTTSPGFAQPTRAVAARHPDIMFFNAGGVPAKGDPQNIDYYNATIEEGRYITGELAGMVVEPGANLGYVAASPVLEVFRGENAFALGVMKTNPTARVYNRWTLTRSDPSLERQAAESLLNPPISASLLSQHQDSPATQLAAQDAGKFGIGYGADMSDVAPNASLTAAVWNWTVHNRFTIQRVCPDTGSWRVGRTVTTPEDFKYWMGTFKDGAVQVAPLNTTALANHPRKDQIQKLYDDEVAAFKSGQKSFESIFTGPIKDNEGRLRIERKPDIGALYDERGRWFVENVVGSPNP
jgi:basic membrane protein A and related proteins